MSDEVSVVSVDMHMPTHFFATFQRGSETATIKYEIKYLGGDNPAGYGAFSLEEDIRLDKFIGGGLEEYCAANKLLTPYLPWLK